MTTTYTAADFTRIAAMMRSDWPAAPYADALDAAATLAGELAEAREQIQVGLQISGSFFEALKPLNLTHIYVENPGRHVAELIAQLTAARADLAQEKADHLETAELCKRELDLRGAVPVERGEAVNLARHVIEHDCPQGTTYGGIKMLCYAVLRMDAALGQPPKTADEIRYWDGTPPAAKPVPAPEPADRYETFGYALAMRVLQSGLYAKLDDRERAECDEMIRRGQAKPAPQEDHGAAVEELEVGAFYWAIPANDPDTDEVWESCEQPARYAGNDKWNALGVEDGDWPMKWVGPKIVYQEVANPPDVRERALRDAEEVCRSEKRKWLAGDAAHSISDFDACAQAIASLRAGREVE